MEEKTITAYQGKYFQVTLQSMLGSTNYGWCLASLPEGIVFIDTLHVPVSQSNMIGPINQIFVFGVTGVPQNTEAKIQFKLLCLSDYSKKAVDEVEINIIMKAVDKDNINSSEFVKYSENSAVYNSQMPYGFPYSDEMGAMAKYGYPCSVDANLKYGYPCGVAEANLKYGYPCGVAEANLKYGYPCGVAEANLKYGYPCGTADATKTTSPAPSDVMVKYGYTCGAQEAMNRGSSCNCESDALMKYGYPCVADANLKYGYPSKLDPTILYGVPYGPSPVLPYGPGPVIPQGLGPVVKYGFPVVDYGFPRVAYGYPMC